TDKVRPWLLQYGETDWSFIARHSEALGYGYWVDDDGKLNLQQIEGGSGGEAIVFRDEDSQDTQFDWSSHANVFRFSAQYRSGTTSVQQQAWDPATAAVVEKAVKATVPKEAGSKASADLTEVVKPFGSNDLDRSTEEATAASNVISARRQIYNGTSDSRSFAPGHIFDLSGHEEIAINGGYTIITVKHQATQEFSPGAGSVVNARYSNTFSCIADKQKWAPERKTPVAQPPGLITGKILSLDDPDKLGRYQVTIPSPDKAIVQTDWIRMMQRFAFANIGDQAPLEIETEVVLSFVNGDIDQPIIMGALHNGTQTIPPTVTYGEADTELKLLEQRKAEHFGIFSGEVAKRQQLFVNQKDKESFVSLRGASKQELLLDATDSKEFVQLNDGTREHWLEFDQAKKVSRIGSGDKTDLTKQQSLICDETGNKMTLHTGSDDDMLIEAGKSQATTVETDQTLAIKGNQDIAVDGDVTKKDASLTIETTGDHAHKGATHTLEGDDTITLKVGGATAEITSSSITLSLGSNSVEITDSAINVVGSAVSVESSGSCDVTGASVNVTADGACSIESSGACTVKGSALTVEASGVCTVKGASVALG
ncbi:MAG: hypothetical protein HRU15_04260, partial [Planctomycetes bacterium]|nr:hypothetical protein [Planctomycetota bacterium]